MPNEPVNPATPPEPGIPAQDRWKIQIRQCLARGDFSEAKNLAQKALEEFPDDPDLLELEEQAIAGKQRLVQAYQWMEEGQQLCAEHNFEEGLQVLRSACSLVEHDPSIRSALVEALLSAAVAVLESDLHLAEVLAQEAVSLDPANPVANSVTRSIQEEKQERLSSQRVSEKPQEAAVNPQRQETPLESLKSSRAIAETARAITGPPPVAIHPVPTGNPTTASTAPAKTSQEPRSGSETGSGKAAPREAAKAEKKVQPGVPAKPTKIEQPAIARVKTDPGPAPVKAAAPQPAAQAPARPRKAAGPRWVWAVAAVVVLSVCGVLLRNAIVGIAPKENLLQVEIRTVPPGAEVRINGESRDVTAQVSLPPGRYRLEAILDGYQTVVQVIEITAQYRGPIELALLPALPGLRLSTDLARGLVLFDGQPAGELQDGQFAIETLQPGQHTLTIRSGNTAEAVIPFEVLPANPPALTAPIAAKNLRVILVSHYQSRGNAYTSFGPVSLALDGQHAGTVPLSGGLALAGLTPASHQLVFGEGRQQQKVSLDVNPAGGLLVALSSDRNVGSLEIVTNEAGFAAMLNGKPGKLTQQRGRYYIRNIDAQPVTIQVVKDGFRSDPPEQEVTVRKGETTKLSFHLTPIPTTGNLRLVGLLPDTRVSLDGAPYEFGPGGSLVATLHEGEHRIELTRPGFQPKSLRVTLQAGKTVTLSGSDVSVDNQVTGKLVLTSRSPASAKVALQGHGSEIPVPGPETEAPEGDYTLVASAPGYRELSKPVRIAEGIPVSLEIRLPLIPQPVHMEAWDEPSGWKLENGWYTRKGGMFLLYRPSAKTGAFQFMARHKGKQLALFGGGNIQWVVRYVDARNYDLYQIDKERLSWRRVVNGKPGPEKKALHRVAIKEETYRLELEISPGEFSGKIYDGQSWKALPRLDDEVPHPLDSRFGLFLPGNEEMWVNGVEFKPRE